MKKSAIAYWLIPAEPARTFFARAIVDLARRYKAPMFEPHMTIYVGSDRADAAAVEIIAKASRGGGPIEAKAFAVRHSGEFVKTLFVQFALNPKLRQLNRIIRGATQDLSDYELKPHLSLLYKKMSILERRRLAGSIEMPFSAIIFDSIKAVRCVSPTLNRADVEAWCVVVASTPLCG